MSEDDARPAGVGRLLPPGMSAVMPAVLPAVLAVLFVAVVAVSVVLWGEREDEQPAASDTSAGMLDVRALAEDAATAFFTLDHRNADANIEAARALMTDDFGADYAREAASLKREVEKLKLSLVPTLPDDGIAIERFGQEAAQVLVSVDVTTTAPSGVTDEARYRTRVALVRDGDGWLVSGLDQVG